MYDVRHVLRKAGLRSTYSGYNYLASAVALVLKDQEFYLKNVTSNLYRVVGEQYGVSNMCVEAAIRTIDTGRTYALSYISMVYTE